MENISQRTDTVDFYFYFATWFHRQRARSRTASDHVTRKQCDFRRQQTHDLVRRKDEVADPIILAFASVEYGPDRDLLEFDAGGNNRSERSKRIKGLGAGPLGEMRTIIEQLKRGHIVDAGIAKDVIAGFACGYLPALLT